jgi:NADH-quinone oxidoreductase subunit J
MIEVLFYIFSFVLLISAAMVLFARHPVHAVLFLIVCFFNAAGIFLLVGAEFLAMMLVIVYVGAVAVLFLFVVMMLDVDFAALRQGVRRHLPLGAFVGLLLLAELTFLAAPFKQAGLHLGAGDNTRVIGTLLYTEYLLPFQMAGLVLLTAMIGAIVLTIRTRPSTKKQSIARQLRRNPKESVTLIKVEVGASC